MSKKNKFVITNPQLCIACNACMKTCIKNAYIRGRLDKSRLDVLTLDIGKMPNQCRQCDDAPCVNVCPTSTLRIVDNCIEIHEELCIGCKICTIVCPYGAINIAAQIPPSIKEESLINLQIGCVSGLKSIALKCDLCSGRSEGPACVEICPKGALVFVDPRSSKAKFGKKLKADMSEFLKKILPDINITNIPQIEIKKPKISKEEPTLSANLTKDENLKNIDGEK